MRTAVVIAITLGWQCIACSEEFRVSGRVVGEDGRPIQNAVVSAYWRANGHATKPDGTPYDLADNEDHDEFWGNLGDMQPWREPVETGSDGKFMIPLWRSRHLMVMDSTRTQGAMVEVHDRNVEVTLRSLVTVRGRLESVVRGQEATWSHVSVDLPDDPDSPLLSRKVVLCGTVDGDFEFLLPRGTYQLNCYGRSSLDEPETLLEVSPRPTLLVDGKVATIEMGVLDLVRAPPDRVVREMMARNAGRWRDFTQHFGEPAPEWHAIDARGITTQTKIRDFRGKWLLIYFWGLGCLPCLENGIPDMIAFYDQHAADRDRFEVVGICIDHRGKIRDLKALDDALGPIIAKVWNGRRIWFPLVLDDSFVTWERYGIPGLGTTVLVDPEGNLTKGDASDLARLLHGNSAVGKD